MLGLERAVVLVEDELDELLHEGLVALRVLLLGEVGGQHEVEVPGGGVAGHPGKEAVLAEQRLDVAGRLRDPLGRDADVLDDQRGSRRPEAPDQAVQPLAHGPGDLDPLGVASEVRWADQLVLAEDLLGARHEPVELTVGLGAELHQQRRGSGRQLEPVLGRPGDVLRGHHQGRSDHQLDRGRPGFDQRRHRLRRRLDAVEVEPGDRGPRRQRNGLEDRLGDEAERALGADQEAPEDLQRLVLVQEGTEPVAGRVLDPELAPDPLAQLLVGADLVAHLGKSVRQLGLGLREALRGVGGGRVDHRSRGQDEGERADRAVGVGHDSATHPAGVVGEHTADAGDVGARRIGPELAALRREHPVGVAEHGPGLDPCPSRAVENLHPAPVPPHIDQDAVRLRLAVQARAARAEGDRDLGRARVVEHLRDVLGVASHHHGPGKQPIGARVRRVADQVDHPGEDAVLPEQSDQLAAQRLGRPRGELIRRPVIRRLIPLGRDPVNVGGEEIHGGQPKSVAALGGPPERHRGLESAASHGKQPSARDTARTMSEENVELLHGKPTRAWMSVRIARSSERRSTPNGLG